MLYNYKYNGKELQETGMYDFGWRHYMPDIGRWNGMDQLTEKFHSYSPYAYVLNNPVSLIDPDGRDIYETDEAWVITGSDIKDALGYFAEGGSYSSLLSHFESGGSFGDGPITNNWATYNPGPSWFGRTWTNIKKFLGYKPQPKIGIDGTVTSFTEDGGFVLETEQEIDEGESVGQPGEWESIIPVWGTGRAAVDHFQNGNYWQGALYTGPAISDLFLVKSIATGLSRGAWKLGSHSWSATRKWMVKNGYAGKGEPLHHWAITQSTSKKYGLQAIANQPWNLVRFSSQSMHMRAGHGMNYLGQSGYNIIGQALYGTPTWFKTGIVSGGGRLID